MKQLSSKITLYIYRFLDDELSLKQFEELLYADATLEQDNPQVYLALASFNFHADSAKTDIKEFLFQMIERDEYLRWRLKRYLRGIIEDKMDMIEALRGIVQVYHEGYFDIPEEFRGYESALDDVPSENQYHLWNPEALQLKLKKIDVYRADILKSTKELLFQLEQDQCQSDTEA